MCFSKTALFLMLILLPLSASAEWLEFGPGCPENSSPRTFHNITLDNLISFDVELQGLLADTVLHDSIPYLRFHESPGTTPMDSVGYIGDAVKFRENCDLIISPADLEINRYPTRDITGHGEVLLYVTVRNAGAQAAGAFDVDLEITDGSHDPDVITGSCAGLAAGEERALQFAWTSHGWFSPPGELTLTASADDPGGQHPDSWLPNNSASVDVLVRDFYPNEEGWPLKQTGSVQSPPLLLNIDEDDDLEIVAICGRMIRAYDCEGGTPLWSSGPFLFNPEYFFGGPVTEEGFTVPAAGDITGDGVDEIVVDTRDRLVVLNGSDGSVLADYEHENLGDEWLLYPHAVVLADIYPDRQNDSVLEIAVQCKDSLTILDYEDHELELLDCEPIPCANAFSMNSGWQVAEDLNNDGYAEIIHAGTWQVEIPAVYCSGICIYDDASGRFGEPEEWEDSEYRNIPAAGSLPSSGQTIACSMRENNTTGDLVPAMLIDPDDLSQQEPCEISNLPSSNILCCIMADWESPPDQADRILANAENQCFVWYESGTEYSPYPIWYDELSGAARPPFPALGKLDDEGSVDHADFLAATREGSILAYDDGGDPLGDLGFPYLLPASIYGGFAIADIDNDGYVEVVFGTMDNYLHVWQLGECEERGTPPGRSASTTRRGRACSWRSSGGRCSRRSCWPAPSW